MDIFLLYFFVYSLALVNSLNVRQTTRQNGPVSSYIGAVKTAKLINLIRQIREQDRGIRRRTVNNDEMKDAEEPNIMESMKLLQKNYDTSRKYDKDNIDRPVNIQYISNPEVLDIYRKQPARRQEISYITLDRQRAYGEEVKRNSRLSMHMLNKPDRLMDYRKHNKALSTSSSSSSTEKDDEDSISDDDDDSKDDETRRDIVPFHVEEYIEATDDTNSEEVPDVTLKPEEAFDIVKPFIVEIFNKLKERNANENQKDAKRDNDDFYDPKKTTSSVDDNEKLLKLKINEAATEMAVELRIHKKEPQNTDKDNQPNENILKEVRDKQSFRHLTTPDEIDVKDSWREKEKEKYNHRYENMSHEKRNSGSRENRDSNTHEDNDWKEKKPPASKKSFVEPAPSNAWDDKGYGYWKKTNWDRKAEKNSGSEENHNNKDNFDEIDIFSKKHSKDNKNEVPNKDSKTYSDKDNSGDRNKKEKSQYFKNYDDDRDKKEREKNDWDKPANKKDDWDKPANKKDDWDKPANKKDDWDKPANKKDDWDKPANKKDDWDKPANKKDDWDKPANKKDDWDKPAYRKDDWDKPSNKKDDWDKPGNKNYDWDKPLNKKDDWDKPKSDNDDWYKPNRDKDDWDKPKKKKDDWDTPKDEKYKDRDKKNLDWDKDEDRSNKKEDNWNKKKDDWKEKEDDWHKKKDDDWNDKDTKIDKKLPDNKNRDKGWDMVGLDNRKRSAEKPYERQSFGDKKKGLYSEQDNHEIFSIAKGESHEKDSSKDKIKDDFKDDYKPKKKNDWDRVVPKFDDNYDRPKKRYNSHEKRLGNSAFGRTSIPVVGKTGIYAD